VHGIVKGEEVDASRMPLVVRNTILSHIKMQKVNWAMLEARKCRGGPSPVTLDQQVERALSKPSLVGLASSNFAGRCSNLMKAQLTGEGVYQSISKQLRRHTS